MRFSEAFINEVKERNDIESVVGEYVQLQRKGRNLMALCPFHAERTPSFCVYPASSSFYCFGCGAGGDAITFLRLTENYDYPEAVKYLAEKAGLDLEISPEDYEVQNQKLQVYKANREAAKFFYKKLFSEEGKIALNYLKKRGVDGKTINKFGLGYSPKNKFEIVDFLNKKGYNSSLLILSNLAFSSRNGGAIARFSGRLMFPIIDLRGNVIGFGARTLTNEKPKYINTSETPAFKKSSNLFALNFAKKAGESKLILTEGYMDVVSLHQAGFEGAVAGLGTALTQQQVKILSRFAEEIVVSYDADEAGQKATKRSIELFRENGVNVKVVNIPGKKDPDEYIKAFGKDGAIKFKNLISEASTDVEYEMLKIKENLNFSKTEDKLNYLKQCIKILSKLNVIEKEIYASKISEETNINKSAILLQVENYKKQRFKKEKKDEIKNILKISNRQHERINPEKHINLRVALAEESFLSYIVNNQEEANEIFKKVPEELFLTKFNKKIYQILKKLVSNNKILDITNIASENLSLEETGAVSKLISHYNPGANTMEALQEYIAVLKEENEKIKIKAAGDTEEINNYIKNLKK